MKPWEIPLTQASTGGGKALSMIKMQETDCLFCVSLVLKLNYRNAPRTQALPHSSRDAASIAADSHRTRMFVDQIEH